MGTNRSVVGCQPYQSMPLGDEPMRMRLKPAIKYDKKGNRLPDLDNDGNPVFIRRKWYANFKHNKELIGNSLDAYEPEEKKAQINLGKLMEKLDNGETVGSINKKLRFIIADPDKVYNKQFAGLWRNHVCRLLGDYKVSELTPEIMAQYMEAHWGLNEDEELQVMFSSFDKERQVLQTAIRKVKPHYSVKKELLTKYSDGKTPFKYNENFKEQLPPLTPEQIYKATLSAKKSYWGNIFSIMLYTGMEAKDIYDLKPKMIKDGEIKKLRHKNKFRIKKTKIDMPIVPQLQKILDSIPRPLNENETYFKGYKPWEVSDGIRDIFTDAGLDGYGAKSLRRYVGEEIASQYMIEADKSVKEALAHSETSKSTGQYTRPRRVDLQNLMNRLAERIAVCGR